MYRAAGPETILSERYEVTEPVERGAAAFTAFGFERMTGRPVFMKARDSEYSKNYLERTYSEADQQASFQHPQIPSLIEAGQSLNYAYLVMERMPGNPYVQKWLSRYPDHELAVRLTLSAAEVLAVVHEKGKVHRDVKDDNLRMQWSGQVALLDFELMIDERDQPAHGDEGADQTIAFGDRSTRITGVGNVVGTPAYMPPEQLIGKPVTPRSDIYALGVTMYGLTYGHSPFSGTPKEQLQQTAVHEINFWPPGRRAPSALRLIMEKATQPNPDQRYESVQTMAEDIERFLVDGEKDPGLSIVVPRAIGMPNTGTPTEQYNPHDSFLQQSELAAAA